ncbi:MAG: 30S ribosomal protein S12 methylthiotransferase RimO [Phycisphaerales bacterium]|nr:30S ribosomal protein S12 methylthiotransferase RimO [Phycisphaerales bacterium]
MHVKLQPLKPQPFSRQTCLPLVIFDTLVKIIMAKQKQTDPPPLFSVALVSLGCPKNLIDSEKMLGLLTEDNIAVTPDHEQADAIVINTCGFLEASKIESLEVIREAIALKQKATKAGRTKRVIVVGCLVQRHKTQLLEEVPEIDALVGVFDRQQIVNAVRRPSDLIPKAPRGSVVVGHRSRNRLSKTLCGVADRSQVNAIELTPITIFINKLTKATIGKGYTESDRARLRLTPRHYAYLRISEGCNQGCTFCTIPSIRGRMRSKPLNAILAEARELFNDGTIELNLIGQDTTSYGSDIGDTGGLSGVLRALDKLASKHSKGRWIRLMYAYPSRFTDEMIKTLADCQNVVKYIDMPLQHINDEILHAMRRRVTRKQIETLLDKLRQWVPGIALRTTFITGFPGETTAHHKELLKFVQDFGFENLGVFEFSPEPGTPAARGIGIPPMIAAQRKEELMLAQQQIVLQKNQAMIGQTIQVLIDNVNPKKKNALARHAGQAPDVDSCVYLARCTAPLPSPGEILNVKIENYDNYDLIARPTTIRLPFAGTSR